MHIYSFEKLHSWILAKELCKDIYKMTRNFPLDERYRLMSQIRRSSASICATLAEGMGRSTNKDKAHFSNLAYATTIETLNHLIIAFELDMITEEEYIKLRSQIENIARLITLLRKSQLAA